MNNLQRRMQHANEANKFHCHTQITREHYTLITDTECEEHYLILELGQLGMLTERREPIIRTLYHYEIRTK